MYTEESVVPAELANVFISRKDYRTRYSFLPTKVEFTAQDSGKIHIGSGYIDVAVSKGDKIYMPYAGDVRGVGDLFVNGVRIC